MFVIHGLSQFSKKVEKNSQEIAKNLRNKTVRKLVKAAIKKDNSKSGVTKNSKPLVKKPAAKSKSIEKKEQAKPAKKVTEKTKVDTKMGKRKVSAKEVKA